MFSSRQTGALHAMRGDTPEIFPPAFPVARPDRVFPGQSPRKEQSPDGLSPGSGSCWTVLGPGSGKLVRIEGE